MRSRHSLWIVLGLLVLAGLWFFWPSLHRDLAQKNKPRLAAAAPNFTSTRPASTVPVLFGPKTATNTVARTNQFAWRLSNTPQTIGQLMTNPHAILLENAFIDTDVKMNLAIPRQLQSPGDPGAYIVQANGPIDGAFRAVLATAGAQIVSYIPNNAYLVRISSGGAAALAGQPPVHSVIPYDPLYKVSAALIGPATEQKPLATGAVLTLGLFADNAQATMDQIKSLGGTVVGTDRSPFGPVVRVIPPQNWMTLAALPGVQIVELAHRRAPANDLARETLGISADTVTPTNYMNLSGKNVLVEVNDTGVDANHPDFSATGTAQGGPVGATRVIAVTPTSMFDTNGHGTHVAGIIAGNGSESRTINTTNTPQGSVTNADFRGKAPLATLYSFAALDDTGILDISDQVLQEVPATNNALISNNSWVYDDSTYDLAAASYDAAVRDALPLVTGSQPVLFVFAAGNDGGGDDSGGGGFPDSIMSPGTAKDVITVGALQQLRNITNVVTDANGNSNAVWQAATGSANEVAGYSSRGNVGIGTEGTFGRFKPDVVAPGSFVVSTRSAQWDTNAYYNPTNVTFNGFSQQVVQPNTLNYYPVTVPANAVEVDIFIVPNASSSSPFPLNLPIYVAESGFPTTTVNDGVTFKNEFDIPADAAPGFLPAVQNGGFNFAVGNTGSSRVNYDVLVEITTTNDMGNYFQVLDGLNETLAPYYRYETGTSMATPAVSGTLALMQDYFTNHTAQTLPSPALMKALVINGSRSQGTYDFAVTNDINLQGWGLPSLPAILPFGLTNQISAPCTTFFLDQSPTNALATGQSQTFMVNIPDFTTEIFPLRVTLAWTDPPGNPAAAIKLVNSLELVVTNLDSSDPNFGSVYFGNDLDGGTNSEAWITNTTPNIDMINNVQNVFLPALLGKSYSVTVIGRSVNVNAVTAQTNNVVQDYALVISSGGDGAVTNGITVTQSAPNPFIGPQVTFVGTTNVLLINQLAGGNTPLLGTNTVGAGAGYITNAAITVGMTNQWHFYVVTNRLGFTNAAFITFLSQTLATPRMGVFADDSQNPTQPDADIDLYVAGPRDPLASSLTNLNPVVLSNCVHGINGDGASLANSTGTEFVAYTNSLSTDVYYIGVKSETQVAAEYAFLPVFSLFPFSTTDTNGNETVNGLLIPVNIPDGSPAHPGVNYVFALAVQPVQIQDVIVTNTFFSQNFGDLVGTLQHSGVSVVINNHNSPPPTIPPDIFDFVYDDSPQPIIGSQPPDGPGNLKGFQGQQGIGPWILTEVDNSLTQTSSVTGLTLFVEPNVSLTGGGADIALQPMSYFYGFVDVPAGATNLTIAATNITVIPDPTAPGQLFEKLNEQPAPPPASPTNFDKMVIIDNPGPFGPNGVITVGPSDLPPIEQGRYFVTLYNPSAFPQNYHVTAFIALGQVAPVDFGASGPTNLLDDAVMYSSLLVTNTLPIATIGVGLRVDHPRISDLVFHLISPDGTRYLLMENRGADSTNGCGLTVVSTNDIANFTANGTTNASTNFVFVSQPSGTVPISWNFFTVPDEMTVYDTTNNFIPANLIFDTGLTNGIGQVNLPYTTAVGALTIIINQFGNPSTNGDAWNYTAGGVQTNYYYLTLTQDTNLTTTPIKFAPPPFVPDLSSSSNLNYQPEQSLDPLVGTSAFGTWQLEIQDDRVGATNHTVLDSWQLQIAFSQTNPVPANLGGGLTNSIPPGGLMWSEVDVPTNADFATNILTFATGPVNVWFSTNAPPTIVNPFDVEFLTGQTTGSVTLSTNGSPVNTTSAYMVPGGTYFIGIQNPGAVTVQFGFQVDFHLILSDLTNPYAFTQPAQAVTGTSAQLNGMATPNGAPATAWFEWGTNTLYGNQTPPVNVGSGSNVVYMAAVISPLVPNLPYHFRLVVSNAQTVVFGFDQILDEATVAVWGADFAGQANVPSGLSNVVAIAGAYNHSLAVKNDETAVGWGDNFFGQATVPGALNLNILAVAGGQTYSLALQNGGNVVAWGGNTFPGETNVPAGLNNVVMIASGDYSSLALKSDGSVAAWGANIFGLTNVPATLSNVVSIAGGSLHNLALKYDGTVVVWGDDSLGQTNVPAGLTNVVAIAAGSAHSLALISDGTVVAWGDDGDGQADVPPGLNNVVAVAAGGFSSLALKSDGSVVAWGDNSAGQSSVPVGLSNVVAVAAGYLHSMALTPFFNPNPLNPIVLDLTNGVPETNTIFPGGLTFYRVSVPTNADFATNILFALNPNQSLNLWFTTQTPPTITNINDSLLLAAATNGSSILSTTSAPTNIVPGSIYYLGVQNTNSFAVGYGIGVDFDLVSSTNAPPQTNTIPISGIIHTNIGGIDGFLLTWFAPSNDLFQVQWSDGLPFNWQTFTNIISYNTNYPASSTNATFTFFDDGSQAPFTGSRYYQLILLGSGPGNTPPVLPLQTTQTVNPLNPLIVTNTATDSDTPAQTLTYTLTSTVTGANVPVIDAVTGIITWTPDVSQAGTSNVITTVVTDNGVPPLSATNSFSVIVNPVPGISSITYSNGGFLLTWFAPTNDIFQVQVATNLASPAVWLTFTNVVTYTGPVTATNGLFSFYDDGSQFPLTALRFYQLILVGIAMPANTPPVLPLQTTQIINPLNPLIVTNTATDSDTPAQTLTYTLTSTVTGANVPTIDAVTGIITWTPDVSQAGTSNVITTVVTDNGVPPLSATNSISVIVNPVPGISSVTFTGGGFMLTWFAPTNDIFQVQVATNLASPTVWLTIGTNITYTGPATPTNGLFSYFDDGSQVPFGGLRFYRLQLTGITPPATTTVPIGSIIFTNGGFVLTWTAPTNDQFNVRWSTNLVAWTPFPDLITSTNGVFTFTDTNAPLLIKFYDLLLLP